MKLKLERWKSNQNQEERHLFLPTKNQGLDAYTYVLGYNPRIINPKTLRMILALIDATIVK